MRNKTKSVVDSWNEAKDGCYDEVVAKSLPVTRFLDLKLNQKMIHPGTEAAMPHRSETGYDPTRKYRMVWDVMTHNMNSVIKEGGKDLTFVETTWPNESFADAQGRLRGKKAGKGGQHAMLVDARRRYVYSYTGRHKYHPATPPYNAQGMAEVKRMNDDLRKLVKGAPKPDDDKRRQIFTKMPHITMDNHFSGDRIIQLIGESGGKGTWTTARGRLPGGIPKKHLHGKKDVPINARSKAARFENPVVAVKHVTFPAGDTRKPYTVAHVTFQSTGGTNITCVNALSQLKLFVRERSKGQGETKRILAIEMNEGRELYLKTYSGGEWTKLTSC